MPNKFMHEDNHHPVRDFTDKNKNLSNAKNESEYTAMEIEGDKQIVRDRLKEGGYKPDSSYYYSPTKGLPE